MGIVFPIVRTMAWERHPTCTVSISCTHELPVGLHYWSTTVLSFSKARPGEGGVQLGFLRIREVCFPGWRQRCLKVLCRVLDLST